MQTAKISFKIPMDKLGALQEFVMSIQKDATNRKVEETVIKDVPAPKEVLGDTGTGTIVGATPEEEQVEESKKVDMTMLRDLAISQTKNDPKRLSAALAKFNAKKLSQVAEADYEALYVELGGDV